MGQIVAKVAAAEIADTVSSLRAQMARLQGRRIEVPVLPVLDALATLLPGGGLRPGASYSLGRSTSLLFALLARASRAGSWCAVVGVPHLGAEAAGAAGLDLSRLVLIPDPGERWLAVTATIADVVPLVVVRPSARAKDSEVTRLAARLREREAVLLVQGAWPQAEAVIDLADSAWSGVGAGHGILSHREVTVVVSSRRFSAPRSARVLLPDTAGVLSPVRTAPHPLPLRRAG